MLPNHQPGNYSPLLLDDTESSSQWISLGRSEGNWLKNVPSNKASNSQHPILGKTS
jgi:hypothetical protein